MVTQTKPTTNTSAKTRNENEHGNENENETENETKTKTKANTKNLHFAEVDRRQMAKPEITSMPHPCCWARPLRRSCIGKGAARLAQRAMSSEVPRRPSNPPPCAQHSRHVGALRYLSTYIYLSALKVPTNGIV